MIFNYKSKKEEEMKLLTAESDLFLSVHCYVTVAMILRYLSDALNKIARAVLLI